MEAARPGIMQFGLKDYVVDDGMKKRTVACKVCSSKISGMITTSSNLSITTKPTKCAGFTPMFPLI